MFSTVRDYLDHLNRLFFFSNENYIIAFIEKREAKSYGARGKELIVHGTCPFFCRRAPPGKCRIEPLPVRVRSKRIQFVPKESKCHCCCLLLERVSWQYIQTPSLHYLCAWRPPRTSLFRVSSKSILTNCFGSEELVQIRQKLFPSPGHVKSSL